MRTYPFDPTTGNRLMKNGYAVNAIQPMTQVEVDMQHDIVNAALEKENSKDFVIKALQECALEIEQYHRHHFSDCKGGCPSRLAIRNANAAINIVKGMK